jgi:large subunit ribosomal protein L33
MWYFLFIYDSISKVKNGGGVMPREDLILRCTECKEENYITTKNKKAHPEKMEIKKFCKRCNKMTVHKEKK